MLVILLTPCKCSLVSYDYLPSCQFPNETNSCKSVDITNMTKCFIYKNYLTFNVAYFDYENQTINQSVSPSDWVVFSLIMWSGRKEINEEIRIITESSLIGSLGGSMGMFFGFSFFTHLLCIFEKIIDRFFH